MFAQAPEGPVELIYLWNEQDIDRLIENLIGHVVACRNNKVPFAAFFATTGESSEHFLSVNNKSGVVQLELPGKGVVREVAENLASFYHSLVPSLDDISQHSY